MSYCTDKIAVVTGAGGTLCSAIATDLARQGAKVVLVGRTAAKLETTAAALGYSAKYVSRMFKQSMGLSFSEYVKNARIQHAVFLMEQGITAVKNIALLCGFHDAAYFSNVFRDSVGLSPSQFIQKKR